MKHGLHFFTFFFPSGAPVYMAPLLIPIEILSYLSRPVSLSVRLFANMMAGHTMMKVFGGFVVALGAFGVAPMAILVALTGFEVLVAVLQAYVFTILTCIYLHDAIHLH
jgi:F-type H+-transporting ATPase subunit a